MNHSKPIFALALWIAGLGFAVGASASDLSKLPDLGSTPAPAPNTVKEAVRTCTKCHDESEETPVLSILKSKHAVMADPRTPFADDACMGCHGASKAHLAPAVGGKRADPDIMFGGPTASPVSKQNETCQGCHETSTRIHWKGSRHETENLSCTSCHSLHTQSDPIMNNVTQTDVCVTCHKGRRAELLRPSTHPMREGEMSCSDCHAPHGGTGPKLLVKDTINETCYTCHAEKRGPFLWEHAPVREDCSLCHKSHGSVNAALLKSRQPWLCQQCHMAAQHPSTAYSGTGLPGATKPSGAQQLLGKSCANCHPQVHGTNHPSGARKTR